MELFHQGRELGRQMLPKVSGLDGLKIVADDYVTKPFSFMELMARVEAVLRCASKRAEKIESYQFGDVALNFQKIEATKGGTP